MAFWDADTIRFMIDACEHAPYNRELAAYIGPRLAPGAHVCDAGCGLGYLSLELARHAGRVTAVDRSPEALAVLRRNCAARGIGNVDIRCGEVGDMPPETPYDAMVFCLFGGGVEGLRIAAAQCRGEAFMVLRDERAGRRHGGTPSYVGYRETCRLLEQLGVPFAGETRSLELGQPFRSLEDARIFFRRYGWDDASPSDAALCARLERTGRDDFPYYLRHAREVGILRLNAADIPCGL